MDSLKRTLFASWILIALLIGIIAGRGATGNGQPSSFAQDPAPVVTLNYAELVMKLDQNAEAQRRKSNMMKQREQTLQKLDARIKEMDRQVNDLVNAGNTDEALRINEQLTRIGLRRQAWELYANDRIGHDLSLFDRDMYKLILEQLADMCERNGYKIVIREDTLARISPDPSVNVSPYVQTQQQIASVDVFYRHPTVDITDELADRLNNAWNAAGRGGRPVPDLSANVDELLKVEE